MGNRQPFMLQDEEITIISEETGFSPAQIERLYSRFTALDKGCNGSLSKQDCLAIPELAINPLCDRIVHMFFIECDDDHDRINFRQFMRVLATFRSSHKSSPLSRSRNVSRQESLNQQQKLSLVSQASSLFDSIDSSPFSSAARHSRHSSYHDNIHESYHGHHTTNQHSFHYAASSNHLPSLSNGIHHQYHHNNNSQQSSNSLLNSGTGLNKKQIQPPIIDLDEPANSKKQKLYFMFKIYDVNNDNLIDLEDLIAIIKMMVGTYVNETRVRKIAERNLREADKDCDGYINFDEFCKSFTRKDIVDTLKVKFPHSS